MMMECPRCGFVQPKDQYCAKCGLDVDHYAAKPKPLLVRIAQSPNVHLSLIVALITVIVAYIFYSQGAAVQRQVGRLFSTPISSREAGEPRGELPPLPPPPQPQTEAPVETVSETVGAPEAESAASPAPAAKPADVSKVEVTAWEVPREALTTALTGADKIAESSGGRAYMVKDAAKAIEALGTTGHRVSQTRALPIENGAQLAIETPPTAPESFQFGLYFQVNKSEGKELGLKWESTMVLPPPEPTAVAGAAGTTSGAAADPNAAALAARQPQPTVRALTEAQFNGSASPTPQSAVLIVFEPSTRTLRDEALAKAGDGPWTVFGSYDFRSGASEWVVVVQLK